MKKKLFMLKKIWIDFRFFISRKKIYTRSKQLINKDIEYPFIFDEKLISSGKRQRLIADFDENGIPLIRTYIDVEDDKLHYYPITIGQVGLSVYQSYLKTKSDEDKTRFLKFADWFIENSSSDEHGISWLTSVPKPEYKVFKPWKSAFAQSRAISILIRAYKLTKNKTYLDTIVQALPLFSVSYDQKGLTVLAEDTKFYEEYVASEATMVLDGHLFTLFAFIDLLNFKDEQIDSIHNEAKKLFKSGVLALKKYLPEFDMGFWLRFNLCKMAHYPEIDPCTTNYMKIIIEQLSVIADFTKDSELQYHNEKFKSYLSLKNYIRINIIKYKTLKKLNRL